VKNLIICFALILISSVLFANDWTCYSPGSVSVLQKEDVKTKKEYTIINFDKGANNSPYWAGARYEIKSNNDEELLSLYLKASEVKNLSFKIFDSKGCVGYYGFNTPISLSKIVIDRDRPDFVENGTKLSDISSLEIIFNSQWFKENESLSLTISDVELSKRPKEQSPMAKMYNWNWMPKVFPKPVSGYEVESCIWNVWTPSGGWGTGNCEFTGFDNPKGFAVAENIIDYYSRTYKNVAMDLPYISGENGEKLIKFAKDRNVTTYAEMHHTPGYDWLKAHDAFMLNKYGQSVYDVTYSYPEHGYDKTNDDVLKFVQDRMYNSARVGVKAIRTVDYTWTSGGGPIWGYSKSAKKRIVDDLNGNDVKLLISENGKDRLVGFNEYFKSYYGYIPDPKYCGLDSWDQYLPPTDNMGKNGYYVECSKIFNLFFHYEWVKFVCEAIKPSYEEFGTLVQPICNPEFFQNGTDLYWMLKQKRALGLCVEWWGVYDTVYSTYFNGRYFGNVANKYGKELNLFGETSANGGSPFSGKEGKPHYYDNISNYLITYSQAGSVDFKSKQDQYIASTIEKISNPKDREYQSFTGFTSAYAGFLENKNDKANKPKTDLLAISNRPITGYSGSFDRSYGANDYNLVKYLFELDYLYDGAAFPMEDAYDINDYKTILYSPTDAPKGFLSKLSKWLEKSDKVLITHSFVPTREATPMKDFTSSDNSIGDNDSGKILGFDDVKISNVKSGILRVVNKKLLKALAKYNNKKIELATPLYSIKKGIPLISIGNMPLVSEIKYGKSKIIYLNFSPLKTITESGNVKIENIDSNVQNKKFEMDIINAILEDYLGYKPISKNVGKNKIRALRFDLENSKDKVFVLFNDNANMKVLHGGDVWQTYQAEDPNFKGNSRIYVGKANSNYSVRNIITSKTEVLKSDKEGYLDIVCDGWNNIGLCVKEL